MVGRLSVSEEWGDGIVSHLQRVERESANILRENLYLRMSIRRVERETQPGGDIKSLEDVNRELRRILGDF